MPTAYAHLDDVSHHKGPRPPRGTAHRARVFLHLGETSSCSRPHGNAYFVACGTTMLPPVINCGANAIPIFGVPLTCNPNWSLFMPGVPLSIAAHQFRSTAPDFESVSVPRLR